jgi:release factor glutamine methyltransferase
MKVKNKLQAISKHLSVAGIESPDKEAEIILRNALNMNVIDIYRDDPELTDKQMSLLESVVSRRTSREPLQYILGHVDFLGLKLQVGKGVLIPRPETELMAELAVKESTVRGAGSNQKTLISKPNSIEIQIYVWQWLSGCSKNFLMRRFGN